MVVRRRNKEDPDFEIIEKRFIIYRLRCPHCLSYKIHIQKKDKDGHPVGLCECGRWIPFIYR